jgi:hypothetical protein
MKRLQFSQFIEAPKNLVWEIMWSKKTFGIWMKPMGEGHYYEPALFEGGDIRWLTPSGDGMFGKVIELIPFEKITIEHNGWVINGNNSWEDTFKSYEIFELSVTNNGTLVSLAVDTFLEYEKLMLEKYPLVLQELNLIVTAAFLTQNPDV